MRIDEIVSLKDVLSSSAFITLMDKISASPQDLNVTRIKNQVLKSWKNGMRNRKHYDKLLNQLDIDLNSLIDK